MKLSELVEGWPEKTEHSESCDTKHYQEYDSPYLRYKGEKLCNCGSNDWNQAREACDKEVMVDEGEIVKIIKKHKEEQREDGDFKKCCGRIYVDPYTLAKSIAQNIKGIIKVVK